MSRNYTPDERLIDQLLVDDTSAFEELHHRYCYSLYSYCFEKVQNEDDAKMIVRDLFIWIWENRHSLPVNFSISLHLYAEVRKSVVRCINNRLATDTIAGNMVPDFSLHTLQQATKPVTTPLIIQKTARPMQEAHSHWSVNTLELLRLSTLKHAFKSVLHFW